MAINSAVILYKDFDASLINFEPVSKNKMGGKMVRLTYGPNKQPIKIQSPELYLPFGVGTYTDEKTGEVTHSIDAALKGMEENPRVKMFHEKMEALDESILNACVEKSQEWLGKSMNREVIKEFFRPLIKPPKDPKYSPLFKIKVIPLNKSRQMPKVYDVANVSDSKELSYIVKGTSAKFIISINSVWFVNRTFGVSARLFQAAITQRPVMNESFAFEAEEDEDYGGAIDFQDD